ncbi:MAG: hypothetical protein JXB29_11235 [Sedimentisphaerales bacterium]|nr:hypothetical protein [Sedimentisphaerales bacterium]
MSEQNSKPGQRTKPRKYLWKLTLITAAAIVLLLALLLPAFVSSKSGNKFLLSKINKKLSGRLDFDRLSMGWLKGIKVKELNFADDKGRTSLAVKQITTRPYYASILIGRLSLGKTIIDQPQVKINLVRKGTERLETQGEKIRHKEPIPTLPIKQIDLVVNNGNLRVTDLRTPVKPSGKGASHIAETVELANINSTINLKPPGKKSDFKLQTVVKTKDKQSNIQAAGSITSETKTFWSPKDITGNLLVEINDLDISSLESIFALAGTDMQAKGTISANIKTEIKQGSLQNIAGRLTGKDLNLAGPALKGDKLKTKKFDLQTELTRSGDFVEINNLNFQTDWLSLTARGNLPADLDALPEFLNHDSKYDLEGKLACDMVALCAQIPQTLGLKEHTELTSGKLTATAETRSAGSQKSIFCELTLDQLKANVKGKAVALSQPVEAKAKITTSQNNLILDDLQVSAPFAEIQCSGPFESLNYNAEVDLAKLQAELEKFLHLGQYRLSGTIIDKNKMSIKKDKLQADGSLTLKDIKITSPDGNAVYEPLASADYSLSFMQPSSTINVNTFQTNTSFGEIAINNAVIPVGEKSTASLSIPLLAKVYLQKLTPYAVMFGPLQKATQIAGTAESNISVTSKEGIYSISTDSTKISNFKLVSPQKQPFIQDNISLTFDIRYNPADKSWAVQNLELASPDIKIKGNFQKQTQQDKTKLTGNADLQYDWAAISSVASAFLPEGLDIKGKRTDSITFSSEYPLHQDDKLLASLQTNAKLGFQSADYMGLNFGPAEFNIGIENGLLDIKPFSATVNNGLLNFAARADFKRTPTLLEIPKPLQIAKDVQLNDKVSAKLLTFVNPIFAKTLNVNGKVNFNCQKLAIPLKADNKNDITVIGTIAINDLQLQSSGFLSQILTLAGSQAHGQDITIHPTKFALQNGFLRYDDMQMDIGDNPVNFKGTIGLDKTLDMAITLPYTTAGKTARLGKEASGERITLPVKGTTDKPELDLGKLLEEQLKQQLQQQLEEKLIEGLDKLLK